MKKVIIMIFLTQSFMVIANEISSEEKNAVIENQQRMMEIQKVNEELNRTRRGCIPRPNPNPGGRGRAVEEEGTGGNPFCGGQN